MIKAAIAALFVLVLGYVTVLCFSVLASGYADALISGNIGAPIQVTLPTGPLHQGIDRAFVSVERNTGVYNTIATRGQDGQFRFELKATVEEAIMVPITSDERVWGIFAMPYPFLIPVSIHLMVVLLVRVVWSQSSSRVLRECARPFWEHALRAAAWACLISLFFQSTRLFWASELWGAGEYLNDSLLGGIILTLLLGLSVCMYLYCVITTAGLRVGSNPIAQSQTCIRCGYTLGEEDGRCPECDLKAGALVPSKWRMNHWHLAAMFVVAFLSPVLVTSVYSVLH